MSRKNVLIVEDEPEIADLILFHVQRAGHDGTIAHSGEAALQSIRKLVPDLLLLDLMLPDIDGLEVCRRLKWDEATRAIPIIIVSAKGEESDVVTGIELGADDYVTKPFSPSILMARMKSLLRRTAAPASESTASDQYAIGTMIIDIGRHEVTVEGNTIALTVTEFGILRFLAARPEFVRTRDQIIAAVHGETTVLSTRTVDVHITALRRKLGSAGQFIETVRGVGYRLNPSPDMNVTGE